MTNKRSKTYEVGGGIYGEMFSQSEVEEENGQSRYNRRGADIEGLTEFTRILSKICGWVEPDTGLQVFPDAGSSPLESGVDLSQLL